MSMSVFVKLPPAIPMLFLHSYFNFFTFLPVSVTIGSYVSLQDSSFSDAGESTVMSSDTLSKSFFLKRVENVTRSMMSPAELE